MYCVLCIVYWKRWINLNCLNEFNRSVFELWDATFFCSDDDLSVFLID